MKMHSILLSAALLLPAQTVVASDDFNTIDTVRYVLDCMYDLGAQNEQNLYTCTCRHDIIAGEMSFVDFEEAVFYQRYQKMPGKRGGVVRDNTRAEKLNERLVAAQEKANSQCLKVTNIPTPTKRKADEGLESSQ